MEDSKKMPHMTLANIAKACGGRYFGNESQKEELITGVFIDSREITPGSLFVPICGERVDGHRFIPDVFQKGALAVLSEQELYNPAGPYILVESTTVALKKLAAFYRQSLDIRVVGITGSVGKTSTKEMIASVLAQKFRVLKTAGNFNNEIGLPLTVFRIREEHQVAVLEMGISFFGEMHRLAEIANPDICVITNIGWCHLENLNSRDGILQAKTECFEHMKVGGTVILNGDDDKLATKTEVNGRSPVFFGIPALRKTDEVIPAEDLLFWAEEPKNLGFDGMQAKLHTPIGEIAAEIAIPGEHNVYNALAAAAVGAELGMNTEEIAKGIASARTLAGRTNVLHCNGMTLIDDCYNANPVSMKDAVSLLAKAPGRTVAVLGDMGELGTDERELHYEVGEAVGENNISVLFCTGVLAEEFVNGARAKNEQCEIHYIPDKQELIKELQEYVKAGDTVLVKASHFMDFLQIIKALQIV